MTISPDFNPQDREQLKSVGISEGIAQWQAETLRRGAAFVTLDRPCGLGDGLRAFSPDELARYRASYRLARDRGRAMKFVPASGAASRMFQPLLQWLHSPADLASSQPVMNFLAGLERMPFAASLEAASVKIGGSATATQRSEQARELLDFLLNAKGLDYARLPKALIPFHRYPSYVRSALTEHLEEGLLYLRDEQGVCRFHFTVSPEHATSIQGKVDAFCGEAAKRGIHPQVFLSRQEPDTSTLALDLAGRLFRAESGKLLLRPGGHGALLKNLQASGGDLVFIKNIDNVSFDRGDPQKNAETEAMAGLLVELEEERGALLSDLRREPESSEVLQRVATWLRSNFSAAVPLSAAAALPSLRRPLRVCGMVRNRGEAGGGPFWVRGEGEAASPQIIEASQVDPANPAQQAILRAATHFNPVDMVCGLKDAEGRAFDLEKFRDVRQVFVAEKSYQGKPLVSLEWPGLWNGGMARWNTVFVEISESNFTPVKTVLDLLKPEHQP